MERCFKCILPKTFPGIKFNNQGICNYCQTHKKFSVKGEKELEKILSQYRGKNGKADCLVTTSGGRDSLFALYKIVKDFGMKAVSATYDWGLMTPGAHRNWEQASKILNVEHFVIPANTEKIKRHIRKNIKTWLKKPNLGMVPIFTQADKQAEYHINKLAKRFKIPLIIGGITPFETTIFKAGFLGVFEATTSPNLSKKSHLKLLIRYLMQFLKNPGYINESLIESMKGYIVQYITKFSGKIKWLNFYDYIMWEENEVLSTIRKELDWESPGDTILTWRTDDWTAPFYNYLHYTMKGFTENDTLRSNQIREGVLNRERALQIVKKENQPRIKAMHDYFKLIGLDMNKEKLDKILKPYQLKDESSTY